LTVSKPMPMPPGWTHSQSTTINRRQVIIIHGILGRNRARADEWRGKPASTKTFATPQLGATCYRSVSGPFSPSNSSLILRSDSALRECISVSTRWDASIVAREVGSEKHKPIAAQAQIKGLPRQKVDA
jgi:hypothetical protein